MKRVFTPDSQSHRRVFSEGVGALNVAVSLAAARAFCERGLPLASSVLFNHRLVCPVMLHQFEIMKHSEINLVRNEIKPWIKPVLCLSTSQQKHRDVILYCQCL